MFVNQIINTKHKYMFICSIALFPHDPDEKHLFSNISSNCWYSKVIKQSKHQHLSTFPLDLFHSNPKYINGKVTYFRNRLTVISQQTKHMCWHVFIRVC